MSLQPFRVRAGLDAEGQLVQNIKDPRPSPLGDQDAVNLRTLLSRSGVKFAGRISNLPSPSDPDPLKRPISGQPYLIKYDLAGNELNRFAVWDDNAATVGPVAEVDVIEPAADAAIITAKAGQQDAGKPFDAGAGTGAILALTAMIDGSISAQVTNGGTGYAIGDHFDYLAGSLAWGASMTGDTRVVVTRLGGPAPLGGWRFINIHDWVKPTKAADDHQYGMEPGDFQATTELNHEELKVWTGSTWSTIVSTDQIKNWIAALSLFEGTVKEVSTTVIPGAVETYALPDLESTNPADVAAAAGKISHYWTWVGQAGYVIPSTLGQGLGRDLADAVMQVGDWVQIANRGTVAAPDLRWVHIGGDLLAKSRADVLYGINDWTAGNYEKGSLVNHKGALYRATSNVTPTDTAPGTVASAGTPAGPGGVPPAVPAVAAAPWAVIPLTAGVHNVPSDADLPATAPPQDVYLVLNSAKGGGKPALFSYDVGARVWIQLGGDGGLPMKLDGGKEIRSVGVPVGCIQMWMFGAPPPGWLLCNGQTFSARDYPELAAMITSLKVPDLRGAYLRGAGLNGNGVWGDAANVAGGYQEHSTAMPQNPFTATTSTAGNHKHGLWMRATDGVTKLIHWQKPSASGESAGYWEAQGGETTTEGNHTHTITVAGGDAETRPKSIFVDYIIKATDQTVTLVA